MRPGTTTELQNALSAAGITTAILASLEFASEIVNVWTGAHTFPVVGTGDATLDGKTFEPFQNGVVVGIGDNSFTTSGSDALEIALSIPAAPSVAISAATVLPAEYQGRIATLWRVIMLQGPVPGSPATWAFRRIRVGAMDKLEISNDGLTHLFKMSIEGHASLISGATGSTYMDQTRFDASDTSQQFVLNCANGDPGPVKVNTNGGFGGAFGGFNSVGRVLSK